MKKTRYTGVFETPSGKYVFMTKIKNYNGEWKNFKSPVFEKAKECYEALLVHKATQQNNNIVTDEEKITLKDVIIGHLESYSFNKRESTVESKADLIKHITKLFDENVPIKELTKEKNILKFMNYVKNHDCNNDRRNRMIATYTDLCERAFYLGSISQQEYGFIKLNLKRYKTEKVSGKEFYTLDQFNQFRAVIDNEFDKVLFDTLFFGGFRIGELLGIQVKDVNDGKINIYKQKNKKGKIVYEVKNEKGKRCNPIKKEIYQEIENYIRTCNLQPNDMLFDTSRSSVDRRIHKYSELADLPFLHKHGFRHSYTCFLIQTYLKNGLAINFNQIADLVGDTVEMVLNVYSHAYASDETTIFDLL